MASLLLAAICKQASLAQVELMKWSIVSFCGWYAVSHNLSQLVCSVTQASLIGMQCDTIT